MSSADQGPTVAARHEGPQVVLVSPYQYDNIAVRLLFAYLRTKRIPVQFVGFKRMQQKPNASLKNDFVEMQDFQSPVEDEEVQAFLDHLAAIRPALIGISVCTANLTVARRLTDAARARFNVPIVWGGPHPTADPESCIQHADIVCIGEGFEALAELSTAVLTGQPYDSVRNLWIRSGSRIIRNPRRPRCVDPDSVPPASFDDQDKTYIAPLGMKPPVNLDYFGFGRTDDPHKVVHQTMTAFGCPLHCSFCIHGLRQERFRRRSVDHVIAELVDVKRRNPHLRMVFFWDNVFSAGRSWCAEFAEKYRAKVGLPFFAYIHPLFADLPTLLLLRRAGWVVTVMGIQTGSARVRRTMYDRRETNDQIIAAAAALDRVRRTRGVRPYFKIYYDFIKGSPCESLRDLRETLDLVLSLPKGFVFQAFEMSLFPGYVITERLVESGDAALSDVERSEDTSARDWIASFDLGKASSPEVTSREFFYLLCSLAQFRLVPNRLLRLLARRQFSRPALVCLYALSRFIRLADLYSYWPNYAWLFDLAKFIPLRDKVRHRIFFRYR